MGKHWIAGLVLVAVFLVAVIAKAPARLLAGLLPADVIQIQDYSGTFWRGSARSVTLALDGQALALGETQWRIHPLSLLSLSPGITLDSQWGRQQFSTRLSVSGSQYFALEELEARFSAALLQRWLPVQLAGTVEILSPYLEVEQGVVVAGAGRLVWHNASFVAGREQLPLGSYALDFEVDGSAKLSGEVITLAGPVSVNGPVQLQGRHYEVDLQLHSATAWPTQMSEALQLIASPTDEGFRVKLGADI